MPEGVEIVLAVVLIGEEVEVALPVGDGVEILADVVGQHLELAGLRVVRLDIGIESAFVAFAMYKIVALPAIVEKHLARFGVYGRIVYIVEIVPKQALRRAAAHRYRVGADAIVARRGEINALRIPAPAFHIVGGFVPGEALDVAAANGHDKHVAAAKLIAAESQPLAIGRNAGPGFLAVHGREAGSETAGSGHAPDVGIVAEIDGLPVGAERRMFCKINGVVLCLKQAE